MVMKRSIPLILLIFTMLAPMLAQQEEATPEWLFGEADYWYTEEGEYLDAAALYKQLLSKEPDHAHAKFMLGMCYNQIRGMEELAIPWFKEATKDITLKYKDGKYSVKQAPHHSWYYLADTYRKINDLDQARMALDSFAALRNFEKHYHLRLTEEAIRQVERAKIIKDAELNLRALYFAEPINTRRDDYSGVISADGEMMVWVRSKPLYQAVFMSHREESNWSVPVEITPQIISDGDLYPTALSADGTTLLLVQRPTKGNSDIYYSQYDGMFWSPAQALHGAINGKSNEEHASFSPDGNRIYFASDRKGGEGALDIWYSDRQVDGQWGEAVNMGPQINTSVDETCAYLAPGEGRFVFSSKGHFNMGGYDVFRCEMDNDGNWGKPVNIGFPVNTTSDDTYYVPLNEGLSALYSRFTNAAIGRHDLWYVDIQAEDGFISDGLILGMDTRESVAGSDFAIVVVCNENGDEIEVLYDAESDSFKALSGPDKTYKVISYKQH